MDIALAVTVKNLNLRREGAGEDEGPLAYDVKITGTTNDPTKLEGVFSTPASHQLILMSQWRDDNELATQDLEQIPLRIEHSGLRCTLKDPETDPDQEELDLGDEKPQPFEISSCKLSKIKLTAKPNRIVDFAWRLQFYPTPEQISRLAELLDHEMTCELSGPVRAPDAPGAQDDAGIADGEFDPLFAKAAGFVAKERSAAVSLLQRHLGIGYNRAATIVEQLEGACIVGPADANGVREILVSEDYQVPGDEKAPTPAADENPSMVPGQKPPQRPKRSRTPETA